MFKKWQRLRLAAKMFTLVFEGLPCLHRCDPLIYLTVDKAKKVTID